MRGPQAAEKVDDVSIYQQFQRAATLPNTILPERAFSTMSEPSASVEANSLERRLLEPARGVVMPHDLASSWFDQTIQVRLAGVAALIRNPELTNHLRRSFGGALGAGASPECAATHPPSPCPWEPVCALDVFFREQMRVAGDGLPKPFVMLADTDGPDLLASLRVFGFATDWMPAAEHAFIDALSHRLPWRKIGVSTPAILDRMVETCEGVETASVPNAVTLDWITPLDAEKIDPSDRGGSILTRLHRRLNGLARWHDSILPALPEDGVREWEMMLETGGLHAPTRRPSRSGKDRRTFHAPVAMGTLVLRGDLRPFWPLLRLGERCAIGRGAVKGQGQYLLRDG